MAEFVFLIHPPEAADIARKSRLVKHLSGSFLEGILNKIPPMKVFTLNGVKFPGGEVSGHFVTVPLTAHQMFSLPEETIARRIVQAGKRVEKLGADIVGLGFSPLLAEKAGAILRNHFGFAAISGNTFTVAAALEAVKKAAVMMGHNLESSKIVILGATQPLGMVCALEVARDAKRMTLVGKEKRKLQELAGKIFFESGLSVSVTAETKGIIASADVVIVADRMEEFNIEAREISAGAVVCELAGPLCSKNSLAENRDDVLVIEGGMVELPSDVFFPFYRGFPQGHVSPAMAETMIMALEEQRKEPLLERPLSLESMRKILVLAKNHGFRQCGLKNRNGILISEEIEKIRISKQKRMKVTVCSQYLDRIIS